VRPNQGKGPINSRVWGIVIKKGWERGWLNCKCLRKGEKSPIKKERKRIRTVAKTAWGKPKEHGSIPQDGGEKGIQGTL